MNDNSSLAQNQPNVQELRANSVIVDRTGFEKKNSILHSQLNSSMLENNNTSVDHLFINVSEKRATSALGFANENQV